MSDLLVERADQDPDATAVVYGRDRLTYAELAARSAALAARLIEHGAGPETIVGLLVERGVEMVVAVFGVLRAGAAYVPLDPDHPPDRWRLLLADAGARCVVAHPTPAGPLPPGVDVLTVPAQPSAEPVPAPRIRPDNLAYVLYTSGSTGTPKGVLVTHGGLRNLFDSHRRNMFDPAVRAAGGRRLRVAHTAALSFDGSWIPLLWLLAGHEVHVIDRATRLDPAATVGYLRRHRVDVLDESTSYLRMLLLAGLLDGEARPRVVIAGGEAVDPDLCAALHAAGVSGYNGYGTTESTVENLMCPAAEVRGTVLGRPIDGTVAYVLDAAMAPVRPGGTGELYLAGAGVARGYLGRGGQTAAAFVADPFGPSGTRMYRTGDLVRRRDDGLLDFLGRSDTQIKINGIRVEPGEVEAALLRHPRVAAAAVVAREDGPGRGHLVGYLVPADPVTPAELRAFLGATLPGALVPARFVTLAELPLTASGKVDRRALPDPAARPEGAEPFVPPGNPDEELIAGIWRAVLGVQRVGVRDDFVELGGDSIRAMRMISALNRSRGTALPAQVVFEHRTVAALAASLPAGRSGPAEPLAAARGSTLPLSFGQQRLWFLDEFRPGGAEYNTRAGYRLRGPLDLSALRSALDALVERHESLRTTFHTVAGRGAQVINPPYAVPLERSEIAEADVDAGLLAEAARPFDLHTGPPLRAVLFRLGPDDHLLALALHHIVTDGWSMGILADELGRLYSAAVTGEPARLPALPFRYADFAAWQRERLAGPGTDAQIAYWERQLAGLTPLELPTDRPRPVLRGTAGAVHRFTVPAELTARLTEVGRSRGATLFTTLVAAVQVFLARHTGQRDIALGTVTSGRTRAEVENLVGFFVNTVVLRETIDADLSFVDHLRRVRSTVLDAVGNDEVPFDRLVELLAPDRDTSRTPLVQVMVVLQNAPAAPPAMAGLAVAEVDLPRRSALFDLTCEFEPRDGGLLGNLEYSTELFDPGTIAALAERLVVLLEGIAADPARPLCRLPVLTAAERNRLLVEWNDSPPAPDRCVHEMFADQVRLRPDAPALVAGTGTVTYRELDVRANRLAHGLIARGAGPDTRVGVCAPRGIDAIVAMLGVLKAGAAYVPLDPGDPDERLSLLLKDSGAGLVLLGRSARDRVPGDAEVLRLSGDWYADLPEHAPRTPVRPDNLVYVMYTSGSAGAPKGVLAEHRSVTRLCADGHVRVGPDDVLAQYAPLSFDAATFEVWGALLSGARLAICPGRVLGVQELGGFLRANGVTTLWLTAGMFHEIAAADPDVFAGLRRLVSGGDVLAPEHCARIRDRLPHLELINGYGPTEGTTFTTCHRAGDAERPVPIGRPLTGTRCYVLDPDLNPVPVGVPGELYAGGSGLARGYLGRPGLTAQRFVADPFGSGTRLYRTGDVARWRPGGVLDFVGRMDDQVKIRGFRVELGEIEAALRRHPDVAEAVVLARQDTPGHRRLVGYVVPRNTVDAGELRAHLERTLPGYLVPAALLVLDRLPLTPNGKVDREALPAPRGTGRSYVPPRGPAEELLARVWAEVLGVERVGSGDNFFDLGGDSILSIQVVSRARQLGLRLTSKDVFLRQTLGALAACATPAEVAPGEPEPVSGPAPLSPIQRWFFDTVTERPGRFNQRVTVPLAGDVDPAALRAAVEALPRQHDALRLRFRRTEGRWRQEHTETVAVRWSTVDEFDLAAGPLFAAGLAGDSLVLTAHHLVVDGVSWRILLEDLRTGYRAALAGKPIELGPRTTPFAGFARRLHEHVTAGGFDDQLAYWATATDPAGAAPDPPAGPQRTVTVRLPAGPTDALLRKASGAYRTRTDDLLVGALARVLAGWTGRDRVPLELEGHGREELFDGVDLTRTVGWFTTLYPVTVDVSGTGWAELIRSVKEQLRAVPNRGIGYGALRYLGNAGLAEHRPLATFNYLGRFDLAADELFAGAPTGIELDRATGDGTARLDVTASVTPAGELQFEWTYSAGAHDEPTVHRLATETLAVLREIIDHCGTPGSGGRTPSDFPLARLSQAELDRAIGTGGHVADAYPLTAMQAGMLFHSLSEPGLYLEQICLTLTDVPDLPALHRAWQRVVDTTPALRTAVLTDGLREPLQVVHQAATLSVAVHDWSERPESGHADALRELLAADRATGLDLARPPLMRVSLIRLAGTAVRVVWTFHHVVLDGWSTFQVLADVLAVLAGTEPPARRPFGDHLRWLAGQEPAAAQEHWRAVLADLRAPTPLPYDRPPGRAHRTRSTSIVDFALSAMDTALLSGFARRHRITVNAVVQGAWARLLARHSGIREVCFGAVVSGRPAELSGVDAIVGMFINTVPVRVCVTGDEDLAGWLRRLQADQVEARRHEHVSLATLRRWTGLPAGANLFDSIVAFENYPFDQENLAGQGIHLDNVTAVEVTNYPLNLVAHGGGPHGDALTFRLGYDPDLFDAGTVRALAAELAGLLEDLAQDRNRPVADLPPVLADPPAQHGPAAPPAYRAPRSATERVLARIWADVLAVDRVGVDDDFFALGGDSILSIRVAARMRADLGIDLPPRTMFDNPTIGALASVYDER
ncbi:MAG TPA: amino acid adenylation domain-containing protein [Actinophytocola sp.]|uniref:non-ribosomal peptide synthetase n=1 Tax=Actinophytocola sp. TaxID=1872138 RepID=UPI002DB7DE79|nr:non-ribosomal peptide synthetase [Actinophytocola sp.]HEU5470743.1 amino acid adenylation domain-containing protein [Actinophytocola sp.]